jgi:hypothetical protein
MSGANESSQRQDEPNGERSSETSPGISARHTYPAHRDKKLRNIVRLGNSTLLRNNTHHTKHDRKPPHDGHYLIDRVAGMEQDMMHMLLIGVKGTLSL